MSKFKVSAIYKSLDELLGSALVLLFCVVLIPAILIFLFAKVTEGPVVGDRIDATVGYAETADSIIELYGKDTDRKLPLSKCETGICFGIPSEFKDFVLQSDNLVTGTNECNDAWAANVRTTLQIPADKTSIMIRVAGQKNHEFLDAMQKSDNLFQYRLSTGLFAERELVPISIATDAQIFNAFYKKEKRDFDKFSNNFKEHADIAAIDLAIQDTFKNPYKKSIDAYSNQVSDQALSSVSGALNATTSIHGFTEKGDIDTGNLLDNVALKQSFSCQ